MRFFCLNLFLIKKEGFNEVEMITLFLILIYGRENVENY